MSRRLICVGLVMGFLAIGCNDEKETGQEGGACFSDGTCKAGLTCASNLCVKLVADGSVPGADQGPGADNGSLTPDTGSGPTLNATEKKMVGAYRVYRSKNSNYRTYMFESSKRACMFYSSSTSAVPTKDIYCFWQFVAKEESKEGYLVPVELHWPDKLWGTVKFDDVDIAINTTTSLDSYTVHPQVAAPFPCETICQGKWGK